MVHPDRPESILLSVHHTWGASFDDPGCMFDNDAALAHSDDADHEIVFSDGKFMQDLSTELLHSFEELAREGSAVMSGLWSMT
jgi:hypothetical protein